MLSSLRRSSAALLSQRFAAQLTSRSSLSKPLRIQTILSQAANSQKAARSFSSTSRYLQYSTAVEEETSEAVNSEYTKFRELSDNGLVSPVVIDTIERMGIHTMTDVQRMTLNTCLDGDDVIAQARTGTGKTLAFLLPIVQRILRNPDLKHLETRSRRSHDIDIRALIVSPTRELAEQIATEAKKIVEGTGIQVQTAVGGTQKNYHLRRMQDQGCHILVGTPGRINDILSDGRSGVRMNNIDTFVLDEADRLLDIGFAPAIDEIQSYMPKREMQPRQTLMFSATVPKSVVALVRSTMRPNFKFVRTVDPDEAPTHERVPQKVVFLQGLQNQMPAILQVAVEAMEAHRNDPANNMPFKAIVYFGSTNEVAMAYEVFNNLRDPSNSSGRSMFTTHPLAPCRIFRMSGKLDQRQRMRESEGFRAAQSALLFSSDVTARGMDFPNVSHVIQVGLPRQPDDYIHRIGRTGRAGKSGQGWLLLNRDEEKEYQHTLVHRGLKMDHVELESASLDMTRAGQVGANVAKLLQMVEIGVKTVPYSVKAAVYQSLFGVMGNQSARRPKQTQIDMMNDLAKYGWGMQSPPGVPRALVAKLGFTGCDGLVIDQGRGDRFDDDRRGRPAPRDRQRGGFSDNDPFGLGMEGGKGVFGGGDRSDRAGRSGGFGGNGRYGGNDRYGGRDGGRDRDRRQSSYGGRSNNY